MGANELIFNLRESGFSINAGNSCLQVSPAKRLTNELKQTIQQSKVEILCALHQEEELKRLVRLVSNHHVTTFTKYGAFLKVFHHPFGEYRQFSLHISLYLSNLGATPRFAPPLS